MQSTMLAGIASAVLLIVIGGIGSSGLDVRAQAPQAAAPAVAAPAAEDNDPVRTLVGRLDLEKYKATIKGLTQFGDRRQGTDRNRAAIDWIEAQLKSYGCTDTERINYDYQPPAGRGTGAGAGQGAGRGEGSGQGAAAGGGQRGGRGRAGQGSSTIFPETAHAGVNSDPNAPAGPQTARAQLATQHALVCANGCSAPRSARRDPTKYRRRPYGWHRLRRSGERRRLWHRVGDGAGAHLQHPDVQTERSIRFALWNNEETGLNGARAYVEQRKDLQGKEDPPGSRRFPEPRWLGMIQHDMMMFDHGMPGPDGKVSAEQRPEADVNIEFQSIAKMAGEAQKLAWFFKAANENARPIIQPPWART